MTSRSIPASASYANAAPPADPNARRTGVCQVCHTRTGHYRADGSDPTPHFTANCGNCHEHGKGFKGTGCTGCHGDQARSAYAPEAPPKDSCGNLGTTGGTGINRVGAHAKHLTPGSTDGVACRECHVNPPVRPDHGLPADVCQPSKRALLAWGDVAKGAVDPWSGAVSPAFDPASQTCSATYCHGNFKSSGVTSSVTWGATLACNGCHGMPPLATHASTDTTCSDCHGAGYVISAVTGTARATHVNGKLEISGTGCSMCHGDSNRVAASGKPNLETVDDRFKSAPPKSASVPGVPATQAHLAHVYSGTVAKAFACADCHPTPATGDQSGPHRDGVISLTFSALAKAGGSNVIYCGPTTYTCSATWCHGDNFVDPTGNIKGAVTQPSWSATDGAAKACTGCHKQPPTDPVHVSHQQPRLDGDDVLRQPATPDTVNGAGAIIVNGTAADKHLNGVYDVTVNCQSCHATPPTRTRPASRTPRTRTASVTTRRTR